ncbi:hypothetical protein D3C83_123640 [compost metagenome]
MRASSWMPRATFFEYWSLISTSTRLQLVISLSNLSAPLASTSACTQGLGSLTQAAKARCVTFTNLPIRARFFSR